MLALGRGQLDALSVLSPQFRAKWPNSPSPEARAVAKARLAAAAAEAASAMVRSPGVVHPPQLGNGLGAAGAGGEADTDSGPTPLPIYGLTPRASVHAVDGSSPRPSSPGALSSTLSSPSPHLMTPSGQLPLPQRGSAAIAARRLAATDQLKRTFISSTSPPPTSPLPASPAPVASALLKAGLEALHEISPQLSPVASPPTLE